MTDDEALIEDEALEEETANDDGLAEALTEALTEALDAVLLFVIGEALAPVDDGLANEDCGFELEAIPLDADLDGEAAEPDDESLLDGATGALELPRTIELAGEDCAFRLDAGPEEAA